ncbi:MAG: VacJ family lipoprotein [Burkholderiales bacterium]|nr:VacJ family lipoprotein [Burkholderiales bacterium]
MFHLVRRLRLTAVCVIVSVGVLGGCASTNDPRDPLEPLNRGVYKFNDAVDTVLLKPVAEVYQGVVPPIARTGIRNVFNNLNDVIVALNNLLQGKFTEAASDVGRIAINTTAGLLGLFDVASPAGLEKHDEDFGQTLGYWGIGDGPYLVLPILGPRNLRDTGGLVVDSLTDPVTYIDPSRDRNQAMGLRLVSRRAELLSASQLLSVAALDEYEFVRDAYIQRRRNLIYDGNPPREKESGINVKPLLALPAEPAKAEDVSGTTADTPAEAEINKPEEVSQSNTPAVAAEPRSVVRVWLQ